MTNHPAPESYAAAQRWEATEARRQWRITIVVDVVGCTLLLTGCSFVFFGGRHWTGAGAPLVISGAVLLLGRLLHEEIRKRRQHLAVDEPSGSRLREPFAPPDRDKLNGADEIVAAFVDTVTSLSSGQWKRIAAAAGSSDILGRPLGWPLLAIDLYDEVWGKTQRTRFRDTGELVGFFSALTEESRSAALFACGDIAETLVVEGGIPFAPPYTEYRLTLAGLHGLVLTDILPNNRRRALKPFDRVLQTSFGEPSHTASAG